MHAELFKLHPDARVAVAVKSIEFRRRAWPSKTASRRLMPNTPVRPQVARYTAVLTSSLDGKWLLASVRESSVDLPSNFPKVESLGWLVGTWTAQRDGNKVCITIRWIANNSFLEQANTPSRRTAS